LSDAGLEVPDFLLNFGAGGASGGAAFGGSDIRGGPVTTMPEDEW